MLEEGLPPRQDKEPSNPHKKGEKTYARVYANFVAQLEIYKSSPKFAEGAVIVREKLAAPDAATPELVTVMIKREKGFSPKTGDWEYAVVEGGLEKVQKYETKGSCARCHANAEATDFVFKTYLK